MKRTEEQQKTGIFKLSRHKIKLFSKRMAGAFGKHAKSAILWLAGLGLFFLAGFWLVFSSWEGKVYVSLKGSDGGENTIREIAAQKEGQGLSGGPAGAQTGQGPIRAFAKEELSDHSKLFSGGKVLEQTHDFIRFYLGNFIAPENYEGGRLFICQAYDSVELVWTGLDSSVSGNEGGMVFRAPCQTAEEDEALIGPFYFPSGKILSAPYQTAFDLKGESLPDLEPEESKAIAERSLIRFYNMTPAMNNSWLLVRARFFNFSDDGEEEEEDSFFVSFEPGGGGSFELSLKLEPDSAAAPVPAGALPSDIAAVSPYSAGQRHAAPRAAPPRAPAPSSPQK